MAVLLFHTKGCANVEKIGVFHSPVVRCAGMDHPPAGGAYFTALPIHAPEPVRPLTPGQEDVLELLVKGKSYQAIADALGIGYTTVTDRVDQIAQLLPYAPEENVNRKEHVMLWGVHRIWLKYMKANGRMVEPAPESAP